MLARLEAHVAEQQRFAANASHELRTPLAITQTLLDVARNDPSRGDDELVDRLHFVNTRAIDLTEALLLLSRADQRSFVREPVDLSLIAEEATETLLPFAEQRGVTIETSGDATPTIGSPALLLQMTTNLVHNAIVHNLPDQGTVWVTTSVQPKSVVLTVENTGEKLTPQLVATLAEPFQRGTERIRTDHAGVGLGLAIVKSITQAHDGTLTLTPGPPAGSASRCNSPPAADGRGTAGRAAEAARPWVPDEGSGGEGRADGLVDAVLEALMRARDRDRLAGLDVDDDAARVLDEGAGAALVADPHRARQGADALHEVPVLGHGAAQGRSRRRRCGSPRGGRRSRSPHRCRGR